MIKTDLFLKFASKAEAEGVFTGWGIPLENGRLAQFASVNGYQMVIDVLFGNGVAILNLCCAFVIGLTVAVVDGFE